MEVYYAGAARSLQDSPQAGPEIKKELN